MLADIVRRVVEVAKPQRIVMFGSAARGTMRPDSDVDLLVIKKGRFHRGRLVDSNLPKSAGSRNAGGCDRRYT